MNLYCTGYCKTLTTTHHGERQSTAEAFLRPAMNRHNLHVSVRSHVTKVYKHLPDTTDICLASYNQVIRGDNPIDYFVFYLSCYINY